MSWTWQLPQSVLEQINSYLLPAVLSVNEVLPDMINNGSGAILFTTGLSTIVPFTFCREWRNRYVWYS